MLKSTNEGYRSLFDQLYVPPFIIGLDKEEHLIKGFLEDNYNLNNAGSKDFRMGKQGSSVMIDGIKGIGKSTLIRKVSTDIIHSRKCNPSQDLITIPIDCRRKKENQVLLDIINGLGIDLDYSLLIKLDSLVAWGLISNYIQKKKNSTINILLNNAECIPFNFYKKLTHGLINLGMNLLITTNVKNQFFIENVDLNLTLHAYSVKNLNKIVDQRCDIAFPSHEPEFPRFITDSVLEFDAARPEPCVSIIRHVYPALKLDNHQGFSLEMMQNCCKESLPDIMYNEFSLIDLFNNSPVQMLIFLDNIAGHFQEAGNFYIYRDELLDLYGIACENLEMKGTKVEFEDFLAHFRANHVLLKSNNKANAFFTLIPVKFLKYYLDEMFN